MAASIARQGFKQVKPVLSVNKVEARRRVLNLYKAWYRHAPLIVVEYDIVLTAQEIREKIRELFLVNKNVTDIRAIDFLVIKGQMDLVETVEIWKQRNHIMAYFKDTVNPKPTNFLDKFLSGKE